MELDPVLNETQRRELQALVRERVERDYQALVERLEEEVRRFEAAQRAAARARAEAEVAARAGRFRQEYLAAVQRYAGILGPLLLMQVALMPGVGDALFYPPAAIEERASERAAAGTRIDFYRRQMDAELQTLHLTYLDEVAARRRIADAEAEAAARQFRETRLSALRASRDRQQQYLEADLERALWEARPAPGPPIPPTESVFEGQQQMSGRVEQANAEGRRAAARAADRNVAAAHALRKDRERLVELIRSSTQALAQAVAREQRLRIEWSVGPGNPEFTDRLRALLRERWEGGAAPPRDSGERALALPAGRPST